ncbi:MAG: polysaccharide deacetylase family protein [Bacteroidales bacterium]|nr:polysaccharide deacetylase family protein [Bacteroidales bacterium]
MQSILSKINFELGRNPKIIRSKNKNDFIPHGYSAVFILSADFELAWAWRFSKYEKDPLKRAFKKAENARKNIPKILNLCDKYNIPITWATVGHLFLEECSKKENIAHPEMPRLSYFENKYWKFIKGDWYDADPCSNLTNNPLWYAPDIIKDIINRKVLHEIACHTFSHIDCSDEICLKEVFDKEISKCIELANKYNIKLKSFVHPGHTIGNLANLSKKGFTSFRTDYRNVLGYPKKHKTGLWEIKSTAEICYNNYWSEKYHIYRYKKIINRAIKYNKICYFWFHPSMDLCVADIILPNIFDHLAKNRDKIYITTTEKYINYLNKKNV